MPEFECPLRMLELSAAKTSEERAYIIGKYAGIDAARRQILCACAGIGLGALLVHAVGLFA